MPYDYIKHDSAGYPYNEKFPPNHNLNGVLYNGYRDGYEELFFFDFAVQRYDLRFEYKGKTYYFLSAQDHAALCDENFTKEYQRFEDGNAVLEQFMIDGKPLIELIPEIEDCEAV